MNTLSISDITTRWNDVIRELRKTDKSLSILLYNIKPFEVNGTVIIGLANYRFHQGLANSQSNKIKIIDALKQVFFIEFDFICYYSKTQTKNG